MQGCEELWGATLPRGDKCICRLHVYAKHEQCMSGCSGVELMCTPAANMKMSRQQCHAFLRIASVAGPVFPDCLCLISLGRLVDA